MKRILAVILAIVCLFLCSCSSRKQVLPTNKSDKNQTAATSPTESQKQKDRLAISEKLQGVWYECEDGEEFRLTLYAFREDSYEIYVLYSANGEKLASGEFVVEDEVIMYKSSDTTRSSRYQYRNGNLTVSGLNHLILQQTSATDLLSLLTQAEAVDGFEDWIICLGDLIANYYPDSEAYDLAVEKRDAAIIARGSAAIANLRADVDEDQNITWYLHKNQPKYINEVCYIYPYIGVSDDGVALRIKLNYTNEATNGWVLFNTVKISIDGQNTIKTFGKNQITRKNNAKDVWEYADFLASESDMELLTRIAHSSETVLRFQGSQYYYDHVVTDKEKAAIKDVLAVYLCIQKLNEQVNQLITAS